MEYIHVPNRMNCAVFDDILTPYIKPYLLYLTSSVGRKLYLSVTLVNDQIHACRPSSTSVLITSVSSQLVWHIVCSLEDFGSEYSEKHASLYTLKCNQM